MSKIKIVVGDWSGDGHGKCENVFIETETPIEVLQQGYKDSCKLTGISFNHNEDYTGLNLDWKHPESGDRKIAVEYESSTISKLAEKILFEHGIDVWDGFDKEYFGESMKEECVYIDGVNHFVELLLKFIKLSVPTFEWSIIKDDTPVLNGWWNKELNVQFGYGLFN